MSGRKSASRDVYKRQVLNKADLAVLVVDAVEGISSWEEEMIRLFEKKEIPYLVVYNKMDLLTGKSEQEPVVEHTAYVLSLIHIYGGYRPAERPAPSSAIGDGFMNIPDGVEDEGLPFN